MVWLQTSRKLRSRVDQFALQADKVLLVEDLNIRFEGIEVETWAYVPHALSALFERRLKLYQFPISLLKREGGEGSLEMKYVIKYNIDDHDLSSQFGKSMGKQIGKATLQEDNIDPALLTPIFRVLDGRKIRILEIKFITLSDEAANFLLSTVKSRPVEQLSLVVWNVTSTNKVDLLLELSSFVKSLHIDQHDGEGRYDDRFFFGEYDRDWVTVIVDMLSRRCDKLHIDNRFYQPNLGKREVDALIELIPKLDKPVWFETMNVDYPDKLEYEENSYSVAVGPTYPTLRMPRYAMFLNRNLTAGHESIFQLLYSIDVMICVFICLVSPLSMFVSYKAEPLHRNLRIALVCICSHGITGFAPRIVLIYAQYYVEDFSEYEILFTTCTILRRTMMCFLMYIIFYFTVDRLIATYYWSWYESERPSTLIGAFALIALPELAGIQTAMYLTFMISYSDSSIFARYFFIGYLAGVLAGGCVLFVFLLRFNQRALKNLQRRSHFNKYSLNRTYQLRENLVIMKLAASVAIPAFMWTSPCFIFIALYRLISDEYFLAKMIFVALYDIWIGVSACTALCVFPFADHRFRKAVAKIPIVRLLLPYSYLHKPAVKVRTAVEIQRDKLDNTDVYFKMLIKDLA